MAERRPLVVVAGDVKELPSGDTLPGSGGGGSLPTGGAKGSSLQKNSSSDGDATWGFGPKMGTVGNLSISSATITLANPLVGHFYTVEDPSEGQSLTTISGGNEGDRILLLFVAPLAVTIANGAGNIACPNFTDLVTSGQTLVEFISMGSFWLAMNKWHYEF